MLTLGSKPPTPAPVPVPGGPAAVRLVAVGDILMHQDVKKAAQQAPEGFRALWAEVEPLLTASDIAFANLETPVAPSSGRPGAPFQFNAPAVLPAALKASGFTVLATANNHAYDQGAPGVVETLRRLEEAGLKAVGSGLTRAQAEAPRILAVNGLQVAVLAFTDLFNTNCNGQRQQPWVRPLDPQAAAAAVRAARAQADAVVVSLHWGVEYAHEPQARQRKLAAALAEAGADLILGHHPHVLQPVEVLYTGSRRTVVAYSMGNFIANQDRIYQPGSMPVAAGDSRDGVALQCRLVKRRQADGSERVQVEDLQCEPLWTENNWRAHRAGQAQRREIRVLPVNAAIRAGLAKLERLRSDPAAPPRLVVAEQDRMRTLYWRRARAMAILGPEVEMQRGKNPGP